jgi:gliding motility-associated-like protein
VRAVRLEGQPVDLQAYPPEILDHGLVVHFPRFGPRDTQKLLEVVFDAKVVQYGTEFSGRIYDRERDEVRQLVDPGDATNAYSGRGVSVTMPFSDRIISSVRVEPLLFTPNGDGINEQASISYALLNLTAPVRASLAIYDLSGRQLRQVQQGVLQSGIFQWSWDGRTGEGSLVPPGNYLYRILVKADNRDAQHTGVIAVAY